MRGFGTRWAQPGQAWDAFVNEMGSKYKPSLAAPTDGWKQPDDDSYYRAAIRKSQERSASERGTPAVERPAYIISEARSG